MIFVIDYVEGCILLLIGIVIGLFIDTYITRDIICHNRFCRVRTKNE